MKELLMVGEEEAGRQEGGRIRLMAGIAIILVEPKYAENIGAAARVALNWGISRLIVVREAMPEREKMLKMATHNASHIIDALELYPRLEDALAEFSCVVGTTARQGRTRREVGTPGQVAEKVIPFLHNNRVALVFGREDKGLTNEELLLCTMLSTIPTATFSSLNLAQAVAVHCYEIFSQVNAAAGDEQQLLPRLAEERELEEMYRHLDQVLRVIGFHRQADHAYWMRNIRQFLGRLQMRSKEARTIRGICRKFLWHDERGRTCPDSLPDQSGKENL